MTITTKNLVWNNIKYPDFNVSNNLVYLQGKNGSGKTTLLKILLGITQSYSGDILINRQNIDQFISNNKSNIGYFLHEFSNINTSLKLKDALLEYTLLYKVDQNEINQMISLFKLEKVLNQPVKKLSLGEKQKASLICSLAHEPNLIILDEAFNGLDTDSQDCLVYILNNLGKERLCIFTSHDKTITKQIRSKTILLGIN